MWEVVLGLAVIVMLLAWLSLWMLYRLHYVVVLQETIAKEQEVMVNRLSKLAKQVDHLEERR